MASLKNARARCKALCKLVKITGVWQLQDDQKITPIKFWLILETVLAFEEARVKIELAFCTKVFR